MTGEPQWDARQQRVMRELEERWPVVAKLDRVRQQVLVQVASSIGVTGLMAMRRIVAAVEFRFWVTAAEEIATSQWLNLGKRRARALAEMMRTGQDAAMHHPQSA